MHTDWLARGLTVLAEECQPQAAPASVLIAAERQHHAADVFGSQLYRHQALNHHVTHAGGVAGGAALHIAV